MPRQLKLRFDLPQPPSAGQARMGGRECANLSYTPVASNSNEPRSMTHVTSKSERARKRADLPYTTMEKGNAKYVELDVISKSARQRPLANQPHTRHPHP